MPVTILAAFPELWPAAAILFLLFALSVLLVQPLTMLLSQLPVVGSRVAAAVGGAIGSVVDWAKSWAAGMVHPLLELLSAPVQWAESFAYTVVSTFDTVAYQLGIVAQAAAGQLGSAAVRLADLAASIVNLSAIVTGLRSAVTAAAAAAATLATRTLPAAIAGVETWAADRIAAAVAAAATAWTAADDALRAWAQAAIAAATAPLLAELAALRSWAVAAVAAGVRTVEGELSQLGTALGQRVGQLENGLGQLLGVLAPLLALNLVQAFPRLLDRVDTMERECVNPVCEAITPQLDTLQALGSGVSLALFLELVAAAVHDPAGTARTTAASSGELRDAVNGLAGPTLGLRL